MDIRIKDILKEKGLNMKDLAEHIGIAATSLSRSLSNNPTYETLKKIADALNVPFTELFERPKQNVITCPRCGTALELREPGDTTKGKISPSNESKEVSQPFEGEPATAESPAMNNNQLKIEGVNTPAQISASPEPVTAEIPAVLSEYQEFTEWLKDNAPMFRDAHNPLTEKEYNDFVESYGIDQIKEVILRHEASGDVDTVYDSPGNAVISWIIEGL